MAAKKTYLLSFIGLILVLMSMNCSDMNIGNWFGGQASEEEIREEGGYTILLTTLKGPAHDARAKKYKRKTQEDTGWNDLYIVHKSGHSELYWGRYRTIKDAQPNLEKAKKYKTPYGGQIYAQALVVPVPGEDIGPPEWNLRNARGTYSLLVAIFQDDPERNYVGRKRFAVEYCRRLRENGYEGYYYHSTAKSAVTIGTFGPSAARVTSDESGTKHNVILDPKLKALKDEFPRLAINGSAQKVRVYNRETKKFDFVATETYLIKIPDKEDSSSGGSIDPVGHSQFR